MHTKRKIIDLTYLLDLTFIVYNFFSLPEHISTDRHTQFCSYKVIQKSVDYLFNSFNFNVPKKRKKNYNNSVEFNINSCNKLYFILFINPVCII